MIVDVPAFNVMLVGSVMFQTVPVLVRVTVLAPRFSARTLVLLDEKEAHDTAYPLVVNVPLVSVTVPVADKASCKEKVPPTPLNVTPDGNDTPFDVIVFVPDVAEKLTFEEPLVEVVPPKFQFPKTKILFPTLHVPVNPVRFTFLYEALVVPKAIVSEPAVTSTLMALASPAAPIVIVRVPVVAAVVNWISGLVPVTVRLVAVDVVHTVAPLLSKTNLPVDPNANVLTLLLLELTEPNVAV